MACESAKEAWDKLRLEFQGSHKTKQMQIFNLRKEFELLRLKETEKVKDYIDRVMKIVNQIRLLGEEFEEKRIVQKPMLFKPWSKEKLLERRRVQVKVLLASQKSKTQSDGGFKKQSGGKRGKEKKDQQNSRRKYRKYKFPLCPHYKKTNHTENYYWCRLRVHCRSYKQFGHVDKQLKILMCGSLIVDAHIMTANLKNFKCLDGEYSSKVRLGDGRLWE
ncbi:uncharacterized protein LOC110672283 [Hevea brasiliensis]|uniref:uncharacterized protein LOC110672283 n=1 Tax=Hevea brasiliensis TaxID=3981 RepID=UPI0025D00C6B|nr:uncharacterized protein LOC110672283 [Hevea brasiliensis]